MGCPVNFLTWSISFRGVFVDCFHGNSCSSMLMARTVFLTGPFLKWTLVQTVSGYGAGMVMGSLMIWGEPVVWTDRMMVRQSSAAFLFRISFSGLACLYELK